MAKEVLDYINELRKTGEPFAVATVVEMVGSVSAKTSSKAVIDKNGRIVAGWVGGGCAESMTCTTALNCIDSGETTVLDIDMNDEVLGAGMPCGGSMRVYIEPVIPKPTLWIMGHGRVAECICTMGDLLGLNVIVNDPIVDRDKYPNACQLVTDDMHYEELKPLADDYVVIATQHKGDHKSMKQALASDANYIALIASRKRSRLVMDYLRDEGFGDADLDRVMAPSGLDLAPQTPEEIALCVISEIVMIRRNGTGLRMRDKINVEKQEIKAVGA